MFYIIHGLCFVPFSCVCLHFCVCVSCRPQSSTSIFSSWWMAWQRKFFAHITLHIHCSSNSISSPLKVSAYMYLCLYAFFAVLSAFFSQFSRNDQFLHFLQFGRLRFGTHTCKSVYLTGAFFRHGKSWKDLGIFVDCFGICEICTDYYAFAIMFSACLSTAYICSSIHPDSSGQILLPRYLMHGLRNHDETLGIFTSPHWWPD